MSAGIGPTARRCQGTAGESEIDHIKRAIATAMERGRIDLLVAMTTTRLAAQEKA
jgi:hypothetical protein